MAQTILITGASTGIGAATARAVAEGNVVFVHYNESQQAAQQVAADVARRGGTAHLVQADLTTEAGCRHTVDQVAARTDRLDVLVNNAGGLIERQRVPALTWEMMERVFALNTFSTMMMTRLCVPLLQKGEAPCIVNVTSIAMRSGAPTATVYAASKGAVDTFTRGSARELAPHVRVNAVAPGVIETPFHDKVTAPELLEQFKADAPLKKNGTAEDVAGAIVFLIRNPFTTGETLDVNGGMFMR